MGFVELYHDVFAALARPLCAADQVHEGEILSAEQRLGIRLPDALRKYYSVAGRMLRFNGVYDQLHAPKDLCIDRRILVFMSEKQGVFSCGGAATRFRRIDPAVYSCSKGSPWRREGLNCSDFLILMVCSQGVNGGMPFTGYTQVGPEIVTPVVSRWGVGRKCLDLRAYYRPGQALCVIGPLAGEGGRFDILVGGRTKPEFNALEQELANLGIDWLDVRKSPDTPAAPDGGA